MPHIQSLLMVVESKGTFCLKRSKRSSLNDHRLAIIALAVIQCIPMGLFCLRAMIATERSKSPASKSDDRLDRFRQNVPLMIVSIQICSTCNCFNMLGPLYTRDKNVAEMCFCDFLIIFSNSKYLSVTR